MGIEFVVSLADQVTGPAKSAASAVTGLADKVSALAESSGGAEAGLASMVGPIGLVVAAAAAATVAFVGLVLAGTALAIQHTELNDQLRATFSALGGGAAAGAATMTMLDDLSAKLPQTREAIAGWTKQFMSLGVTAPAQLEKLNTAAASAQAIMGDPAAADAFVTLEKKIRLAAESGQKLKIPVKGLGSLAAAGLTVDDVAKKMGISAAALGAQLKSGSVDATKFGDAMQDALIEKGAGPLAAMGATLSAQWGKFGEKIAKLFDTDDVRLFVSIVKQVVGLFLGAMWPIVQKLAVAVKAFAMNLLILGLKGYIALKPLIAKFKEWAPHLAPIITGIEAISAVAAGLVAIMAVGVAAFVAPFIALGGAVLWALGKITELFSDGYSIAADFVSGLVKGITGGISSAVDAAKNLASSALNAVKDTLGIASDSKEMIKLGGHTAGGMATGLDRGAPAVENAAGSMAGGARDAAYSASSYAGGGGGGGGKGVTVNVGGITINGAGKGAEDLTEEFVSLVFERVALAQGVG